MQMIEIEGRTSSSEAEIMALARNMYALLGSNMTAILSGADTDWQSRTECEKWIRDVFLAGLAQRTRHLLLLDGHGLRGFLSFTLPEGGSEVYINEIQIRPSAQGDGVTFKRLVCEFALRVAECPQSLIRTYANLRNARSQRLILKFGFRPESATARGVRFLMDKASLLNRTAGWRERVSGQPAKNL